MEEAESLCRRIGIMVDGKLACLGPPARLRARFGKALQVEIKAAAPALPAGGDHQHSVLIRPLHINPAQGAQAAASSSTATSPSTASLGPVVLSPSTPPTAMAHDGGDEDAAMSRVAAFMVGTFPGATLVERHGLSARFQVPFGGAGAEQQGSQQAHVQAGPLSLSSVFRKMEAGREGAGISEYAVGQASLDSIFNAFASGGAVGAQQQQRPQYVE